MSSGENLRIPRTPQLTWEGMRNALCGALYVPPASGTEYSGPADALRCGLEVAWGCRGMTLEWSEVVTPRVAEMAPE